jgi:hypothetical protein
VRFVCLCRGRGIQIGWNGDHQSHLPCSFQMGFIVAALFLWSLPRHASICSHVTLHFLVPNDGRRKVAEEVLGLIYWSFHFVQAFFTTGCVGRCVGTHGSRCRRQLNGKQKRTSSAPLTLPTLGSSGPTHGTDRVGRADPGARAGKRRLHAQAIEAKRAAKRDKICLICSCLLGNVASFLHRGPLLGEMKDFGCHVMTSRASTNDI